MVDNWDWIFWILWNIVICLWVLWLIRRFVLVVRVLVKRIILVLKFRVSLWVVFSDKTKVIIWLRDFSKLLINRRCFLVVFCVRLRFMWVCLIVMVSCILASASWGFFMVYFRVVMLSIINVFWGWFGPKVFFVIVKVRWYIFIECL